MNRRDSVLALLALVGGGDPMTSRAQQGSAARPLRIGLVPDFVPAWAPMLKEFTKALAELGRVEGRDYVFIHSRVFYGPETQPALDRVMEVGPDLLLTANLGYAVAAQKATKTIPIVMWVSGFPVEGGVADSLAKPGGNVTGLTIYASGDVFGKLVQIVHAVRPGIKRISALMTYVPPFHPRAETDVIVAGLRAAAQPLAVDLQVLEIAKPEQVDAALAAATAQRAAALVLTSDASIFARRNDIMRFAVERRLPTIVDVGWESAGDPQPLLQYEADFTTLIRQAAPYVDQILWRGAKPGALPIQLPSRFVLTVNQKTAKAIGLGVPRSLLLRADHVIE